MKYDLLRKKAEALCQERLGQLPSSLAGDMAALLEDLHIQQIELEHRYEELRSAEIALLRDAKEQYREHFELAPIAFLVLDSQGRVTDVNRKAEALLKRSRSEIVTRAFEEFVEETHRNDYRDALAANRSGHEPSSGVLRLVLPNDEPLVVEMCAELQNHSHERSERPDVLRIALTQFASATSPRDRAAATKTKERLHPDGESAGENEPAICRAIVETAADAILTASDDGTIRSFNASAERLFGSAARDVLNQDIGQLIVTESGEGIDLSGLDDGASGELFAQRKNGKRVPISLSLSRTEVARSIVYCGIVRDLTKLKKTEAQLRHVQKMEAIGTLASGIAHDFNNLLMGVSGCATIALESMDPYSAARMYVEEIKKSAESDTAITRQLLNFGRKREHHTAVFQLNQVLANEEHLLHRLLGEDILLDFELMAVDSRVRLDVGQAEQILLNLAVNARDAMPHGGHLKISTEETEIGHGETRPGNLAAGSYVALSVTDEGCGMRPDLMSRVFEPFYTSKEQGKGTGLGLSTVYAIAQGAGGTVQVESEEGVGSTFTVLLPLATERITMEFPIPVSGPQVGGDETILLVEDEAVVAMAVRHYLQKAGYRVLMASTGPEAVECCRHYPGQIDLLLSDIALPGMCGDETAHAIKTLKPAIRVLYMSAHAPDHLAARSRMGEEAAPPLQKPFEEAELLTRVRAALEAPPESAGGECAATPGERNGAGAQKQSRPSQGRILMVEGDCARRAEIGSFLAHEGWKVEAVSDACEAREILRANGNMFDVFLTDYALPDGRRGDELAREFVQLSPSLSVVYLSTHPNLAPDLPGSVFSDFSRLDLLADELADLLSN